MGPKKAIASRPKRKAAQVNLERQTKRRNEEKQASAAAIQAFPPLSMSNRSVTTGRKVMFDFLERKQFRIAGWLRAQGWEKFCSLKVATYPKLVKEFFENLRVRTSQLESTVKGCMIVLDEHYKKTGY